MAGQSDEESYSPERTGAGLNRSAWARSLKDDQLVDLMKLKDHDAFSELCRRYEGRLLRAAIRIMRNREDAEDAVQETFLKAYWKIDGFKGDSLLSTWLTSITVNACLMQLRRRRSRPECSLDEPGRGDDHAGAIPVVPDLTVDIEGACLAREQRRRLDKAIARLSPVLRSTLETHLRLDCTLAEVASRNNITIAAVKSRLLRARLAVKNACVS